MPKELSPIKKAMVDAGYSEDDVAVMSPSMFGVVSYWAGERGGKQTIPAPDEVDDCWKLEGTASDVDKLVSFWRATKGGQETDVDDPAQVAEEKKALPSMMGSPFVKKTKKK